MADWDSVSKKVETATPDDVATGNPWDIVSKTVGETAGPEPTHLETMLARAREIYGDDRGTAAADVGREVLQGATLGFGDEAIAGVRSALGQDFETALETERGALERAREGSGFLPSLALEALGGAPFGAFGLGRALAARTVPGAIGAGAGIGGLLGGIAGAGTSEGGIEERLKGAVLPGVLGGVVGGGIPAAGAVGGAVQRGFRNVFPRAATAPQQVSQRVGEALGDLTPAQTADELERLSGLTGGQAALADVNPELRELARSTAQIPGPTRSAATSLLPERVRTQGSRILPAVREATGGRGALQTIDEIETARRAQTRPLYDAFGAEAIPPSDLDFDLARMSGDRDFRRAWRAAQDTVRRISGGRDLMPDLTVGDALNPVLDDVMTGNHWNELQKALEGEIGAIARRNTAAAGGFRGVKNELVNELETRFPDFADARSIYRQESNLADVVEQGRRARRMGREEFTNFTDNLNEAEADAFAIGVRSVIEDIAESATDTADMANKLINTPKIRRLLAATQGTPAQQSAMQDILQAESQIAQSRNVILGGSQTSPNLLGASDVFAPTAVSGNLPATGTGAAAQATAGAFRKLRNYFARDFNQAVSKQMADGLLNQDPAYVRRWLEGLDMTPPEVRARQIGLITAAATKLPAQVKGLLER